MDVGGFLRDLLTELDHLKAYGMPAVRSMDVKD